MWRAIAALVLALAQNPDLSVEGMKALEARNYELAAQWFSKAVQADPKDYAAHFHLALAYSLSGKDEQAIEEYKKTLELKPGLYQAELNLGLVLLGGKQAGAAAPHLEAAVAAKPKEFQPRFALAQAQYSAGEYAKAGASYQAALEIDPKSGSAELGLARSQVQAGQWEEAKAHFGRAVELDASLKDGALELGPLYEKSGRKEEAIALYREYPESLGARERLGQLLAETGRAADAIPHLEWAVGKSPTAANRLALAQAYREAKEPEKGLAVLQQAVAADPHNTDLRMAYGRELRDQRQFAGAAEQFLKAIEARPDWVAAWNEYAAMQISLEDYSRAIAALDRIRGLGGETAGHLYLRAIVLDKVHDLKGALESYQRFLASDEGKNPNEEFKARQRARIIQNELNRR